MKTFLSIIITLLFIIGLVFGIEYLEFGNKSFFMPRYEALRRDTMIQSRAYSEATYRELSRLKLQYLQAKTQQERDLIRSMIDHEISGIDKAKLPYDLQTFIEQIGN